MIVKITPSGVTIKDFTINCDVSGIEVTLTNGKVVEFNLKETESPTSYWLNKLAKAIEDGDWRNVDRAITNLRIHHEA